VPNPPHLRPMTRRWLISLPLNLALLTLLLAVMYALTVGKIV
jgi:hypothetical protein